MSKRLCPIWIAYLLLNPIRKLYQNPEKILSPYVSEGMTVLDMGCAMGYFSLPLARMVGTDGKVICADIQEKMLKSLEKRATKAGLSDRIETRLCHQNNFVQEEFDFALVFAVVHEVSDASEFFSQLHKNLKSDGKVLFAEPKGHVTKRAFDASVSIAQQSGFKILASPCVNQSHAVLMEKLTKGSL